MAAPLSTSKEGIEIIIKVREHLSLYLETPLGILHPGIGERIGICCLLAKDELVSQPYVDMTVKLMLRFGVKVELLNGLNHIRVPSGQTYKTPGEAYVEGDASSASYFLAGATITGGTIVVEGCGSDSLQGDVRFAEVRSTDTGAQGMYKRRPGDKFRLPPFPGHGTDGRQCGMVTLLYQDHGAQGFGPASEGGGS